MSDNELAICLNNVGASYGITRALHDVSIKVPRGRTTAILGINGAGKTTTLSVMAGLIQPDRGEVLVDGESQPRRGKEPLIRPGIALSPEGRHVFPDMTVMENLQIGSYGRRDREAIGEDLDWTFTLFPRLSERVDQRAGTLSGGEQQMLAMGRALMRRPDVLLLDEPTLGLSPVMVNIVAGAIDELSDRGLTIVLVEQSTQVALRLSSSAYVLSEGRVSLHAPSEELRGDDRLLASYLGGNPSPRVSTSS